MVTATASPFSDRTERCEVPVVTERCEVPVVTGMWKGEPCV